MWYYLVEEMYILYMGVTVMPAWVYIFGYVLTFAGVIITCISTNKSSTNKILLNNEKAQAVTDTKLQNITEEVKQLKSRTDEYMEKIPRMEVRIENLEDTVKEMRR